jgi:uncharacterized protein (AIM24 family)
MYKDTSIEMTTVFGDGSNQQSGGFMDLLVGAGKRLLTGESLRSSRTVRRRGLHHAEARG